MSKKQGAFDTLVGEMESGLEPEETETEVEVVETESEGGDEGEPKTEESEPEAATTEKVETTEAAEQPDKAEKAEAEGESEEPDPAVETAAEDAESGDEAEAAREAAQKAMREEIVRLRMKARMQQASGGAAQAPNPAAPAQPPTTVPVSHQNQPQAGTQGPSGDGLLWENGHARVDPAFIHAYVEAAMRPDPQVAAAQREESLRRTFIGMDDGSRDRAATYSRADEALDYFQLKMWDVAQTQGADLSGLGIDGILSVAEGSGLMEEIRQHYPDIAPHVPDFLIAGTLPDTHGELAMRQALSRYHADRMAAQKPAQAPQSGTKDVRIQNTAKGTVDPNRPPSTARVGSPPTGDNASSKAQREVELTDKLSANPFNGLSKAEQDELNALRQDLGL